MKAALYVLLMCVVLWAGFTWERATAPVRSTTVVSEATTTEQTTQVVLVAEPEQEVSAVSQPIPLVSNQDTSAQLPVSANNVVYTEEYVAELELAIHARINEERQLAGLGTLKYDDTLAQIAAYHSTDMAQKEYFAHADKDGCDSACRVNEAGYKWRMVGENLFLLGRSEHFSVEGASAIIVAGWMGSPEHRENILEKKFTYEGVGVVVKGDSIYATELFALPR